MDELQKTRVRGLKVARLRSVDVMGLIRPDQSARGEFMFPAANFGDALRGDQAQMFLLQSRGHFHTLPAAILKLLRNAVALGDIALHGHIVSGPALRIHDRSDLPFLVVFTAIFAVVDGCACESLAALQLRAHASQHGRVCARPLQDARGLANDLLQSIAGEPGECRVGEDDVRAGRVQLGVGDHDRFGALQDGGADQVQAGLGLLAHGNVPQQRTVALLQLQDFFFQFSEQCFTVGLHERDLVAVLRGRGGRSRRRFRLYFRNAREEMFRLRRLEDKRIRTQAQG